MLIENLPETHLRPVNPAEQFNAEMQSVAQEFYKRLFSRERIDNGDGTFSYTDDLADIVAEDFQEDNHPDAIHEEGHVAAQGLEGLRAYRANFDRDGIPPELAGLETIAVPADETWTIPDTDERYDFGALVQFSVVGPMGKIFQVRLREDLKFTRNAEGRLQVSRRMYRGVGDGDQGYLGRNPDGTETVPPHHHGLVGAQIGRIAATGESSPLKDLRLAYMNLFPDVGELERVTSS